jgi:hypothetical protein
VVDDRPRHIYTPKTGQLGPEAYVPILAVGEEVLVEEPDLREELMPVEGRRRTSPEDEGLPLELPTVYLPVPDSIG